MLSVLSSWPVHPVFLPLVLLTTYWPWIMRPSPPPSKSFVFAESMSKGWGLLPLQGHVLVGFWVSKVAGKGLGWCSHPPAFAPLICHHSFSPRRFPPKPTKVSLAFSIPDSMLPSQILVCPPSTSHSHSLTGVRSEFESWLCLLDGHITSIWSLSFPLCKMGTSLPSLNVKCLVPVHGRHSIKSYLYLFSHSTNI